MTLLRAMLAAFLWALTFAIFEETARRRAERQEEHLTRILRAQRNRW